MSTASRNNLTSSFSICIPLIYSSCLMALLETVRTLLKGESGHPCLILDFKGNASNSSPYDISCVFLTYCLVPLRLSLKYSTNLRLNHERRLYFIKYFLCIYWDNNMVFILQLVHLMHHMYCFVHAEASMNTRDKLYLAQVNDLFDKLLDSICLHLVEEFCIYDFQGYFCIILVIYCFLFRF